MRVAAVSRLGRQDKLRILVANDHTAMDFA